MNPEQLLRQAEAALQRGATPEQVNARLEKMDTRFNTLSDLRATVEVGAGDGQTAGSGDSGGGILEVSLDEAATGRGSTAVNQRSPGARQQVAQQRLQQAQAALDRGASREAVNSRIRSMTNGRIRDFGELQQVAESGEGVDRGLDTAAGLGRTGLIAGDVASLGFLDELAGVATGLGSAAVPGGRGFGEGFEAGTQATREATERARRRASFGSKATGNLLGILAPALASFGAGAVGATTRAGAGAFRGAAGLPARIATNPATRGAVVGAAETAAAQVGSAEGSLEERAENLDPLTILGGGALGGILGGVGGGRAASEAKPTAGSRLARRARERSGLEGRVSTTRRSVREAKDEIQEELFAPLEEIGRIEDDALGRTLRQNDDIAEVVKDQFPNVAEGQPPTFRQLQTIRSRIKGLKEKALRQGDSFNVNKWTQAKRELTEQIEKSVEGFEEAQRAWARESARLRALEEGNKMFTKEADKVQEAFNKLDSEAERRAFREGLATKYVAKLEKLSEPKAALRRIENSPQLREKLRIIFGDEETLEQFAQDAFTEQRIRDRGQLFERIKGFLAPGAVAVEGVRRGTDALGGILGFGDEGG